MAGRAAGLGACASGAGSTRGLDTWEETSNNPRSARILGLCRDCWECRWKGHHSCRRGVCPCGRGKYGHDMWATVAANLPQAAALVVLTAPGAEELPWDENRCEHPANVRCSGRLGCKVVSQVADHWNRTMPYRKRVVREAVRQRLKRAGHPWPVVEEVEEPQKRGVLHVNFVLDLAYPEACRAFVAAWRELGPKKGFGFIDGKALERAIATPAAESVRRVSGYLAGYLLDERKAETSVFAAMEMRCTSRVWSVARRRTMATGVTMGSLKRGRQMWASGYGYCKRPDEGLAVVDWEVVDCSTGAVLRPVWGENRWDKELPPCRARTRPTRSKAKGEALRLRRALDWRREGVKHGQEQGTAAPLVR